MTAEDKAVSLNVTYLLAAGNLYVVTYKIYPNGIVNVNAKFTSTDMQPTETEVSEATRMATFTPGSDAARKAASKLEVPRTILWPWPGRELYRPQSRYARWRI